LLTKEDKLRNAVTPESSLTNCKKNGVFGKGRYPERGKDMTQVDLEIYIIIKRNNTEVSCSCGSNLIVANDIGLSVTGENNTAANKNESVILSKTNNMILSEMNEDSSNDKDHSYNSNEQEYNICSKSIEEYGDNHYDKKTIENDKDYRTNKGNVTPNLAHHVNDIHFLESNG
jgi:hypothetical protein